MRVEKSSRRRAAFPAKRKGAPAMLIAAGFLNNLVLERLPPAGPSSRGGPTKEFVLAESTEVLRTSVVALDLQSGQSMDVQA